MSASSVVVRSIRPGALLHTTPYAAGMDGLRLIYLGDPMCSWCWGIAPELDRLSSQVALPFDVVVGGLRPGPSADRMNASTAARLADHWRHVEARSGQPFDFSILDDHTWTYDTEPACRAVVTMRRIDPDRTLNWFGASSTIRRSSASWPLASAWTRADSSKPGRPGRSWGTRGAISPGRDR